jgi:hypothetical protein
VKRFNGKDGTLLTGNNTPPASGASEEPAFLDAAALLAEQDCSNMDLTPFDAEYDPKQDQLAVALLMEDIAGDSGVIFLKKTKLNGILYGVFHMGECFVIYVVRRCVYTHILVTDKYRGT